MDTVQKHNNSVILWLILHSSNCLRLYRDEWEGNYDLGSIGKEAVVI
jgi:hypothetical protein